MQASVRGSASCGASQPRSSQACGISACLQRARVVAASQRQRLPTQAETVLAGSSVEEFIRRVPVAESNKANDLDYLTELMAIQQSDGPKAIGFFGTRNMGVTHQKLVEVLAYAYASTGNHIYTSGAIGTNAAVIKGALRANAPDKLTVILPQSLKRQPSESQDLLEKVNDLIEMSENDELSLLEASRICNRKIIGHVQQIICFAFHDSRLLMETCHEAKESKKIASALPSDRLASLAKRFAALSDPKDKAAALLEAGRAMSPFPESSKVAVNRVMGCTAQVWVDAALGADGRVAFSGASDSALSAGLVAVLSQALSGLTPDQVSAVNDSELAVLGLGPAVLTPSRANGFANMLQSMKKRARALAGQLPRFPSLLVTADSLQPQGPFAVTQAQYLSPDPAQVDRLVSLLSEKKMGVVAHFYMDPEVQGVLMSAAERWPHIHISDSLVMADSAVAMAEAGCKYVAVLGVDFMSENVRAILDESGHTSVDVYRMSAQAIGCSLAEAAESDEYTRYLAEAAETPNSMHVVYINTSLLTKATADSLVPTITCTSSNVVQTVLQGFAQVPDATVWYGPDTYMGRNLAQLLTSVAQLPDEEVRALHPSHTASTIKALLPRLRYYENGTCIVHHIFGGEVCEMVRQGYPDAYLTAHFEVPGEMFTLAMEAKRRADMGVVGSTSNILDFITAKVSAALERPHGDTLQFVLGTEAGMVTSIVRRVQSLLRTAGRSDVEVEIVFPVSSSAIATPSNSGSSSDGDGGSSPGLELPGGLAMLPGPASGEGCSLEGGCAACPYMRMNTLAALQRIAGALGTPGEVMLEAYRPRPYSERIGGKRVAAAGCVPILHMRHFQQKKALSDALVGDITSRHAKRSAAA
ncbi:hypothetical protein FOA52_004708 [Chlamydomonas sp. UWO 241]|nr:hypothetical protein FOA52_004708 [Chlamydomonas sp. UWO 241]